ncbi:MAG: DUF6580 family putative transport protein [Balneolaceae bacterium]
MKNKRFYIITGFIVLAVLSRILPHPYNFTPLGAIALFGAAYFTDNKWALLVPLVAMWISDLILNNFIFSTFFEGITLFNQGMIWIYGSLVLISLTGMKFLNKITIPRVLGSAVGASVIFFTISNLGVWLTSPMYPLSLQGLMSCYTAAIPFFHNTLAGDLVYCATLFGAFEYLAYRSPALVQARI